MLSALTNAQMGSYQYILIVNMYINIYLTKEGKTQVAKGSKC